LRRWPSPQRTPNTERAQMRNERLVRRPFTDKYEVDIHAAARSHPGEFGDRELGSKGDDR
jgi:hypothetical protein